MLLTRQQHKKLFDQHWNKFIADNHFSPYYLLTNIDYLLSYSDEKLTADGSFIVLKNNMPVAAVFLPIEADTITIGKSFAPAPVFLNQTKLESDIMRQINLIAEQNKIKKIMFRIDPLEKDRYPYNYLLNYDYLDASLTGYLVDGVNIGLRRNHRRAIKKIKTNSDFSIYIMKQDNQDYQIHEQFRELHHKCAGKITRPKLTFDRQYQMLVEGHAILVALKFKDKFIAFTYFTYHAGKAVSYSAADDSDFNYWPLYHIINERALEYFKQAGIKIIDMGQPLTASHQLFYHPDLKQKNISLFKQGFGGQFVPNFQGVKYFDKDIFKEDMNNFISKYQIGHYE